LFVIVAETVARLIDGFVRKECDTTFVAVKRHRKV
jgi:hypothetical protein